MLCPKCQQEVTGKYCSFCGTVLEVPDTDQPIKDDFTVSPNSEQEVVRQVTVKKTVTVPKKKASAPKRRASSSSSPSRQTVQRKTKVKRKKKRNVLSTVGSLTSGSAKSLWKLFMYCIQWICSGVMLLCTLQLFLGFWASRVVLGSMSGVIRERNYAQGIFLIGALCIVGFGLLQTLWMLSRKKMPDSGKVRRIDMGRGCFGFCMFVLLILAARYVDPVIPGEPDFLMGIKQLFRVVMDLGNGFFMLNLTGIILCIIRKAGAR
ncbi:MAG: hypothetical protein KH828_00435 [Clostridiales bacterium]|nr:hypothetical protein [Clostridiales bacterium]